MQNQQIQTIRFPVRYENQKAIIRFSEGVNSNSILNLCDEIDYSITHYYYRCVVVEIDSPGGEVKALNYYIDKLREWRKKGVQVETLALTDCCSAAALMLSLGDLGLRQAMPNANLLYHRTRICGTRETLTPDRLNALEQKLTQTDDKLLIGLLRHLYVDVDELEFDFLHNYKCVLPYKDEELDCNALKELPHLSINRLLSRYEKNTITREDLASKLMSIIQKVGRANSELTKQTTTAQLNTLLDKSDPAMKNVLTVAWLCARFDHYRSFFSTDKNICSKQALSENLIDTIRQ